MAKKWVLRERHSEDLLEQLLLARSVAVEQAADFLNPNYEEHLHDPFLLPDMDLAVERLVRAVAHNERVMIAGDYDADGVLASVLLTKFFQKIGFNNFVVYLPDRYQEQYGLSEKVVGEAAREEVSLIVTVDCGVSDAPAINLANSLGIDVVVTDHHLPPAELPPALAVVNPHRTDSVYPCRSLCGTGVAFKLVQAMVKAAANKEIFQVPCLRRQVGINPQTMNFFSAGLGSAGWEKWLLDLVAIATVADMVPLVGENRALVHFGLRVLRKSPRAGVRALARAWRLEQAFLTEDDIAFVIGPRINAAGRMSHARDAYHLLVTEDLVEAEAAAAHLHNKNEERRGAVDQIFATARERLKSIFATRVLPPVLVLGDPAWSPAVAGLAASRLVEEFDRPAFVWGHNGQGEVKGSCRSNGTVNMVELMRRAHEREALFANYGGHAMAGGFSLPRERLEGLPESLCLAHEEVAKAAAEGELLIDAEWPAHLATAEVYRELERLSPFGVGNAKPLFLFRNLELVTARLFGKTGAHQEFQFNNLAPRVIAFFYRLPASLRGEPGERVDLAASLEKSFFRGRPELRLRLVDLRPAAC